MSFMSVKKGQYESKGYKGRKLTPKMVEFIELYLIHMNATKAISLSSYQTKNPNRHAKELMQHPLVRAEIEKRLATRAEKHEIKAEFLIQKLLNIIDATEVDNPQAALRAIELAGKSIAMWKDRQEVSGPDGSAIRYEQDTKEAVMDFTNKIAGLAKRNDKSSGIPGVSKRDGTNNVVSFPDGSGDS